MQARGTTHLLRQVRGWLVVRACAALPDADLLDRFRRDRDEGAFAVLLERHGPMVLRVCGQLLRDRHAAEDAFQATFLVLARKAASIRKCDSLAAWLHGVACRTTRRLRDRARRDPPRGRLAAELSSADGGDPATDVTRRELALALHEEVGLLPERCRQVIVLCYLEGASRAEAASRLGVSPGSVKKLLERARRLLRRRLTRRGVLPAALSAVLLGLTAGVPTLRASLLRATIQSAVSRGGDGPAHIIVLANEVVRTMAVVKYKSVVLVLVALALLGGAAAVLALNGRNGSPADGQPPRPAPGRPEPEDALRDDTPLPAGATARLGTARWRQDGDVFFVAFDARDRRLITARQGGIGRCGSCHAHPFEPEGDGRAAVVGMARLWDLKSGKMEREAGELAANPRPSRILGVDGAVRAGLKGAGLPTVSAAASPAGDLLAEAGPAGPVRLWDLATGKLRELGRADPEAGLVALAFAPDGKLLATLGAAGRVRLYDPAAGAEVKGGVAAEDGRQVGWGDAVVFAPSGRQLAISASVRNGDTSTGVLEVWDLDTGKRTLRLTGRARGSPAFGFSPDGTALASPGDDGTLSLTDVATGKQLRTLGKPDQTRYLAALAFAPDGKRLATRGYNGAVFLWDVATGRELGQPYPAGAVQQAGNRYLFGAGGAASGGGLAFSHDGKLLAVAGPGGGVSLWDVAADREAVPGHKAAVAAAVFAADGKALYSLGEDGTVRQWDPAGGREKKSSTLPAEARNVALGPDGRTALFATDPKTLAVWDLAAGKTRVSVPDLEGNKGVCPGSVPPGDLRLSPDGKLLARLGWDGAVGVWEVSTGRQRWVAEDARTRVPGIAGEAVENLAFTPDGRCLAVLKAGTIKQDPSSASVILWNVGSGRLLRRLDGLAGVSAPVVPAPDGRTLAVAGRDGSVSLWEIVTGKERLRLRTEGDGPLTAVAYSADSALVIAAGPDQTLWCWDALTGERVGKRRGDQADVRVLACAPDGRTFASGGRDGTLLLWDVAGFRTEQRPRGDKLEAAEERECWEFLAGGDADRAAQAMARLRAAPRQAVALLRDKLPPVVAPTGATLEGWIKDLDSGEFAVRHKASEELANLGVLAEPALRKALEGRPSAEVRTRIDQLLDRLQEETPPTGEGLRELRAVELLERLADPDADKLLRALSEGAAGARLTREASAGLERRLGRRVRE